MVKPKPRTGASRLGTAGFMASCVMCWNIAVGPTHAQNVSTPPSRGLIAFGTNVADGVYDLRYTLFTAAAGGAPLSAPVTNSMAVVKNGRSTVDFAPAAFWGTNLWLDVAIRTNGGTAFTALPSRLPLGSAPAISPLHLWAATILMAALLIVPAFEFLISGWRERRDDLVQGFTDAAISAYFLAFHPQEKIQSAAQFRKRFEWYYNSQFGRRRFALPLLLLTLIVGVLFCWITLSVSDLLNIGSVTAGKLPVLPIIAVMGAYMWVLSDEIIKWHSSDLAPADFYWWCFRFAIAVPMGYAVQEIFSEKMAMPIVFLLGAFPTTQLLTIARRIATQKMGFSDSENRDVSELQSLRGIDTVNAERFASERITTILQLAYCDPIRLTIRTGLTYSYIVDCICQALLWIYVEKDIALLAKSGLRSAYEVLNLCLELEDPGKQAEAEGIVREAAQRLGVSDISLRNTLHEVAIDPYSQFLYLSWSGAKAEQFNSRQKRLLCMEPLPPKPTETATEVKTV